MIKGIDLRDKITIQIVQEIENEYGYPEVIYRDKYKNIRASRRTISTKDSSSESGWWNNVECKFVINYKDDIDSRMCVMYKGNRYGIKHISEFNEDNNNARKYMQIVISRVD